MTSYNSLGNIPIDDLGIGLCPECGRRITSECEHVSQEWIAIHLIAEEIVNLEDEEILADRLHICMIMDEIAQGHPVVTAHNYEKAVAMLSNESILKWHNVEFDIQAMGAHAKAISDPIKERMDARLENVQRLNREASERVRREFLDMR